jgi:hypothetical protein
MTEVIGSFASVNDIVSCCANDIGTPGVAEHCHFIDGQDQADTFNTRLRARQVE